MVCSPAVRAFRITALAAATVSFIAQSSHGAVAGYGRGRGDGYGLHSSTCSTTATLVENNVVFDVDGGGIIASPPTGLELPPS